MDVRLPRVRNDQGLLRRLRLESEVLQVEPLPGLPRRPEVMLDEPLHVVVLLGRRRIFVPADGSETREGPADPHLVRERCTFRLSTAVPMLGGALGYVLSGG